MTYAKKSSGYLQNDILGRPREWLVPVILEHLMRHLGRAIVQFEMDDVAGRTQSIGRATSIVYGLMADLDHEQGGEIADHLAGLYSFWAQEIMQASRAREPQRLAEVRDMVAEIHEAFTAAAQELSPRNGAMKLAAAG